eukprot:4466675-Pyramimonas_sp.AAC.1
MSQSKRYEHAHYMDNRKSRMNSCRGKNNASKEVVADVAIVAIAPAVAVAAVVVVVVVVAVVVVK